MKTLLVAAVLLIPLSAAAQVRRTPAEAVDDNIDKRDDRLREEIEDFKQDVADARAEIGTASREKYDALVTRLDALENRAVSAEEAGASQWKEARGRLQDDLRGLRHDFRDIKSKHDNTGRDAAPAQHEGMSPTQRRTHPAPNNLPESVPPVEDNP